MRYLLLIDAKAAYQRALDLVENASERAFPTGRLAEIACNP